MSNKAVLVILSLTAATLAMTTPGHSCGSSGSSVGSPLFGSNPPMMGTGPPPTDKEWTMFSTEIDLFGPTLPTTCACGIGFDTSVTPLPASIDVSQVVFTRYDQETGQHTILQEFLPMEPNPVTTAALAAEAPGFTWFGFSGRIEPFTVPLLGENEIFTMSFFVTLEPDDLPELVDFTVDIDLKPRLAQFAGGTADSAGRPRLGAREEHPVTFFGEAALPLCLPTHTRLCFHDGRFSAEVTWQDSEGNEGKGQVAPCPTAESGLFWFFDPDNLEMNVKVPRACQQPFEHYWVFVAYLTNVETVLTVADVLAGESRTYTHELGSPALSVFDVAAFRTCDLP